MQRAPDQQALAEDYIIGDRKRLWRNGGADGEPTVSAELTFDTGFWRLAH
ncbi:MAG: hypothetical protein QGF12_02170 [SAR202 cluster bacterium]|nr:hypothetical protein [SAR202 cluster bacterium]